MLAILDGSKALRKAVPATFGDAALVQRCQVHKMRNILEYLNDRQRPWAQAILRRAYQSADVKTVSPAAPLSRPTSGDGASRYVASQVRLKPDTTPDLQVRLSGHYVALRRRAVRFTAPPGLTPRACNPSRTGKTHVPIPDSFKSRVVRGLP